jgi:hypothetical protein
MVSFIGCSYLPNRGILLYSIRKEKILIIKGCEKGNKLRSPLWRRRLGAFPLVNKAGSDSELLPKPGLFHLISKLFTSIS